jgi:hypothetical protein
MIGRMGPGADGESSPLADEARRLEDLARKCEKGHRHWRNWYSKLAWVIGLPAVVLAVAAGTTALTESSKTLTAAVAFAAAVLAGFQTMARIADREQSHRRRMATHGTLADNVRTFRIVELSRLDQDTAIARFKELQDRFHAIEGQPTFPD